MALKVGDYKTDVHNDWCPGCGDFGIVNSIQMALAEMEIPRHETAIFSGIGCTHGSDDHIVDNVVDFLGGIELRHLKRILYQFHGGAGEYSLMGNDSQQMKATSLKTLACKLGDIFDFLLHHLIENHTDDFHPVTLKKGLIEGNLVDGSTDSPLCD